MSTEQDSDPDAAHDTVEKVERTDFGCSMEARLDRGTDTRDQDRVTIKSKGETAAETIAEFYELLEEHEQEISGRLRDIQPGEDEAGE
ncbi:DUF7389 domain-containing protein [Haloarcula rubripromontorii]|uniref:DUF7389 domain-containing protein n=1 Tax=Haloarcula rubripromontorii TaxID=1705562 RepID=A0A0M9AG94_9EURY|nr:hypothetical protein [Haloarcula rubripromontorii]KOX91467.1 hypothetical protein AMS69_18410 [Haloarcula rubripromontorii]NLV05917.1 hypothetical protein [Haloarcula rubripromontorii]